MRDEYFHGQQRFTVHSEAGQGLLAKAHANKTRIMCPCRKPMPEMYVAAVGDRFIVKRMPETGLDHTPDCPSFEPPEELSGLGPMRRGAIDEDPDAGVITLKLGFPLKQYGKRKAPPEIDGKPATEAKTKPQQMSLTALLHYLWHESRLGTWYPNMEGKRNWHVISNALRWTAADVSAKGLDLRDILYIPSFYDPKRKPELASARNAMFNRLSATPGSGTQLGILIGEYKSHEATPMGAKLKVKHAPDCAFLMDQDLAKRFNNVFEEKLMLASTLDMCHVMVISTFSIAKAGYPILQDVAMMLTGPTWIPFEHLRELEVLTKLILEGRAFQKSLRFTLAADAQISSAVLLDTPEPYALFVTETPHDANEVSGLLGVIATTPLNHWLWVDENAMDAFPQKGYRR